MLRPQDIRMDEYVYPLPSQKIAQHPLAERESCKLLVANTQGVVDDMFFSDIVNLIPNDSLLVYNDTRVINARLRMTKATGGIIEIFCLEPVAPADYESMFSSTHPVVWRCLVGNSKKWKARPLQGKISIHGRDVMFTAKRLSQEGADSMIEFSWTVVTDGEVNTGSVHPHEVNHDADSTDADANKTNSCQVAFTFADIIKVAGQIPIPPYLNRASQKSDEDDYQTVYARAEGSVAAPTAGLHFTPVLLETLKNKGVTQLGVTLHVGAGTFQPVKSQSIGGHEMHSEFIVVTRNVIETLKDKHADLVAVGTTSVRTLESLYQIGCLLSQGQFDGTVPQWYAYGDNHPKLTLSQSMSNILEYLESRGENVLTAHTNIIIVPGYEFKVVNRIITNFHQPGSTLLLLVSAFIGDAWRDVYSHALAGNYRFLSYGDACLLSKD